MRSARRSYEGSYGSTDPVFKDAELSETPGVNQLLVLYRQLSKDEITDNHQLFHRAMAEVLTGELSAYARDINQPGISTFEKDQVKAKFSRTVESAKKINFPPDVLQQFSVGFIEYALNDRNRISYEERQAAADLALALGHNHDPYDKSERVVDHLAVSLRKAYKGDQPDVQVEITKVSSGILQKLHLDPVFEGTPSAADVAAAFAREHGRSLTAAGVAAVLSGAILTPNVANATTSSEYVAQSVTTSSEASSSSLQVSPSTPHKANTIDIEVAPVDLGSSANSPTIELSNASTKPAKRPIRVGIAMPSKAHTPKEPANVSIHETKPATPKTTVPVETVINTPLDKGDQKAVTITNGAAQEQKPTTKASPEIATLSASPAPHQAHSTSFTISNETNSGPAAVTTEKTSRQLTPEQQSVQLILNAVNSGDVGNASFLIHDKFHITPEATAGSSQSVDTPINKDLVKNVGTLLGPLNDTIHTKGHTDPNYVNTALMSYAVLDAAANDPTILQAQEVKDMLVNVKRPTDEYQGRLFDQYLAKAKSVLEANNSALLSSFGTDANSIASVETMYAYALMAAVPDAEQATQIEVIKDAEAAAAAPETAPDQTLETAIDRAAAQFGWSDSKKIILKVAAQHGASAAAVAGLGGNVFAESGFDPAKSEYGNNIGFGYIQESYGRRKAMEAAAAAEGANVADPTWQANYVMRESNRRAQRNDSSKNEWAGFITITDPVAAADYWLYNNERAGVPHSTTRERAAQEIYDQINGQIQAIQREAAAAAQAQAEAAAKAKAEADAAAAKVQADAETAARQAIEHVITKKHAKKGAETLQQSNAQKIVAATEAEYAKWASGQFRPLPDGGNTNGIESYLKYSQGIHTSWCAFFVSYVLANVGLPVPTPEGLTSHAVVGGVKRALLSTNNFTWHDAGNYTPKPGDIAFYNGYGHINIVVSGKSPNDFDTIGGNEGNVVAPSYAAKYNGQKAFSLPGHSWDGSYVMEENGNLFDSVDGFLSVNN